MTLGRLFIKSQNKTFEMFVFMLSSAIRLGRKYIKFKKTIKFKNFLLEYSYIY